MPGNDASFSFQTGTVFRGNSTPGRSTLFFHRREVCCLMKWGKKHTERPRDETRGNGESSFDVGVKRGAEIIIHFGSWEQLNIFFNIVTILEVRSDGESRCCVQNILT